MSFKGERVRAVVEYRPGDDGCMTDDVIHVGATGTVTDDDDSVPSIQWDHLPNSPDWCMMCREIEFI